MRVSFSGARLAVSGAKLTIGEAEAPPAPTGDFVFVAGTDFGIIGYNSSFFGTQISISPALQAIIGGSSFFYVQYGGVTINFGLENSTYLNALQAAYQSFTIVETNDVCPIPGTPGSGSEWVYFGTQGFVNGQTYTLVFNP